VRVDKVDGSSWTPADTAGSTRRERTAKTVDKRMLGDLGIALVCEMAAESLRERLRLI
jgi:hypothetical protein